MCKEVGGQGPGVRGRGEENAARDGFTLVELLVVIVIIIILMGLLTPVLVNVMAKAREARIVAEIAAMDTSMKAYKERYGAYPPSDFSSLGSTTGPVALHILHCFPRCTVATELMAISQAVNGAAITPAQSLVLWLSGYTGDPEHPFSGHYTVSNVNSYTTPSPPLPLTSFFTFDTTRIGASTSSFPYSYYPTDGLGVPYVYFAAQNYSTQPGQQGTQGDYLMPYVLDAPPPIPPNVPPANAYVNPNSFQIISAGLDGNYGTTASRSTKAITTGSATYLCSFPSGVAKSYPTFNDGGLPDQTAIQSGIQAYSQGDLDNLTNFSSGNLKEAMP